MLQRSHLSCYSPVAFAAAVSLFGLFALLILFICGCGGNSTPNPPIPIPALNGNFNIVATSLGTAGTNQFGGAVQTDSSGHVTGILHVLGPFFLCFGPQLDLPFSGTIDSTGLLNGTISTSNGQMIVFSAQVSPNGSSLSAGSYTGSGAGCAAGDHGAISGFQVQPFTGTYSGSFSPAAGTTINLSIALSQSAAADANGLFTFAPATATVSGGSSCGLPSAILDTGLSNATGNILGLVFSSPDGVTILTFVGITPDGSANPVTGLFTFSSGPCSGEGGAGSLSH